MLLTQGREVPAPAQAGALDSRTISLGGQRGQRGQQQPWQPDHQQGQQGPLWGEKMVHDAQSCGLQVTSAT
jgi:hypothetical protein